MEETIQDVDALYGVQLTFRVPGSLRKLLSDEAKALGTSLSKHAASILISGHRETADQTAEHSLLIQERRQLQKEMQALESELATLKADLAKQGASEDAAEELAIAKLRKNRQVLRSFVKQGSATEQELRQAGLDFTFITNKVQQGDKQFYCVFDVCYMKHGEHFIIDTLSPQHA